MSRKSLGVIIYVALGVILVAFLVLFRTGRFPLPVTSDPTPTPVPPTEALTPTPTVPVPEDWQTLESEIHGFSLRYPLEAEVEDRPADGLRLILVGPTQTENTEFYDGILLNFDSGNLGNQSLREYVRDRHAEQNDNPVVESVTEIIPATVSGYIGFSYRVTSLGERDYIYLPHSNNRFFLIIRSVYDPSGQGYESLAEQIFSTLTLREV